MIKWNLFQVWKDDSASTNPLKLYATIIKLSIKYMIITIDIEKASDKIQHLFVIKAQQSEYRGNVPQLNKGHIWQTYS